MVARMLKSDDLHLLYYALDIEEEDSDREERKVESNDIRLKAMSVFTWWKKKCPSEATRKTLLMALKECELIDCMEKLAENWGKKA